MSCSSIIRAASGAIVVVLLSVGLSEQARGIQATSAPTSQPGDQTVEVNGPANVTIDNGSIHVEPIARSSTQPATRPIGSGGHIRIRMSGNSFDGNGAGPARTVTALEVGTAIDNPLQKLAAPGVALLKKRSVEIEGMQQMKALSITGNFAGIHHRDIVNADPKMVIVLGKGFITHGSLKSAGPIIIMDDADAMGSVSSDSIVWYVGNATPRGDVSGTPVIVPPGAFLAQARWRCDEVWIGRYGWPEPNAAN